MRNEVTVLSNADIYTMKGRQRVQAIAWENATGIILAVGGSQEVISRFRLMKPRIINLEGKLVLPGFTDSHTHFCNWCLQIARPNLENERSLQECLRVVEKYVDRLPTGEWLVGTGWNRNIWSGSRLPECHDLDNVSGKNPVALWSKDWHTLWVNSLALKLLGVKKDTPGILGGKIEKGKGGRPKGLLREEAANRFYQQIPPVSDEKYRKALLMGQRSFARMGLTGFHSMEGPSEYRILKLLEEQNSLELRGVLYFRQQHLENLISLGVRSGLGSRRLKIGGIKLFADGSLGSQTAWMLKPYENGHSRGMPVITETELRKLVFRASDNGLACAIHAIGDAANRMVVKIYAKLGRRGQRLRHRIEHCQLVSPQDIPRFKESGVIASVQPIHCPSDLDIIEKHWGSRGRDAYPFGSLKKAGVKLAFGSDCPIENPDPFRAIQAAVTRQRIPPDRPSLNPDQRLSVWDCIKAYTADAAYASGDEVWKGTLEPGKVADFICLSDNIFQVDPNEIYKLRAERTFIGGRELK